MKKLSFPTVGLLFLFGCLANGSYKINLEDSKGLNDENLEFTSMLFLDDSVGFVGGSSDKVISNPDQSSNIFAFSDRTALVYRTNDGGNSWTKKGFGEGLVTNITQAGGRLYVFTRGEKIPDYSVYYTDDKGSTWIEEKSLPEGINELFIVDSFYISLGVDSSGWGVKISRNFGKSWSKAGIKIPVHDISIKGKKIYYLSCNNTEKYRNNLLGVYDLLDNHDHVVELPEIFNCYFMETDSVSIKLTGIVGDGIAVYSIKDSTKIIQESIYSGKRELFPQGYYSKGGENWIIVGERTNMYVSNILLNYNSNKKNWEEIAFPKPNHVRPFFFLKRENKIKGWFYGGRGKFQILQ